MRIVGWLLTTLFLVSTTFAREGERSFEATEMTCDGIVYATSIRQMFPNVEGACTAVVQRGGHVYVEFDTEVDRVWNRGQNLRLRLANREFHSMEIGDNVTVLMDGEEVDPEDLEKGDKLKFFLRDDLATLSLAAPPEDETPSAAADGPPELAQTDPGAERSGASPTAARVAMDDDASGEATADMAAAAEGVDEAEDDAATEQATGPTNVLPPPESPKPSPNWNASSSSLVATFFLLALIGVAVFAVVSTQLGRKR